MNNWTDWRNEQIAEEAKKHCGLNHSLYLFSRTEVQDLLDAARKFRTQEICELLVKEYGFPSNKTIKIVSAYEPNYRKGLGEVTALILEVNPTPPTAGEKRIENAQD